MVIFIMWLLPSFLALLLVDCISAHTCSPPTCSTSAQVALQPADHSNTDHIYIGGIFGVHEAGDSQYTCGAVRERGIQNLEAFFWAVRTFKDRYPDKLQGVGIGALAFDSCSSAERALQQVLNLENCVVGYGDPPIQPSRVLGFVGPDSNSEALQLAPVLGGMDKTLISHAATSPALSEQKTFLRTVPSDAEQGAAMASILDTQGWKYVQTVHSSNTYGTTGIQAFQEAAKSRGICIVNAEIIPESPKDDEKDDLMDEIIENLLAKRDTKVVVVFANANYVTDLLNAARRAGIRRVFTWIGTNSWATSEQVVDGLEVYAEGAVTLALDNTQDIVDDFLDDFKRLTPDTDNYNPWLRQYWEEKFDCYFPGSSSTNTAEECNVNINSLEDTTVDIYVPFAIKAVDALLAGIEDARATSCSQTQGLCSDFLDTGDTKWAQLQDKILHVDILGVGFDEETGDSVGVKHVIYNYRGPDQNNCADHCYQGVGTYHNNTPDAVFYGHIYSYFENGTRDLNPTTVCGSRPCLECGESTVPPTTVSTTPLEETTGGEGSGDPPVEMRDDGWVIVLIILAGLGILFVIGFEFYLMSKMMDTPFVTHLRTMWLGQLLLFAIFLSYLTLFAFVPSPTDTTCGILRFGIGSSYAMCFAILLVKLMIIHSSETIGYLKGIYQILMFIFAWGVQIAIDAVWLILREPKAVYDADEDRWVCKQEFKHHVTSLSYVMFLILICTLMSVKTHGIATNHREGIFVGLSAGFAIPVWLAWILLGEINSNSDYEDPCLAFGLFATTTLILFIMFLPKVRQLNNMGLEGIYAEDDGPTPEYPHSIMAPSIRPAGSIMPAGSIIANNVAYLSDRNIGYEPSHVASQKLDMDIASLSQLDGEVYEAATIPRVSQLHYQADSSALYMRHPGAPQHDTLPTGSGSLRSVPMGYTQARPASGSYSQTGTASSRVLRVTNDLTGRAPVDDMVVLSGEPVMYGTARSARSVGSGQSGISLRKAHSFHDLGAL